MKSTQLLGGLLALGLAASLVTPAARAGEETGGPDLSKLSDGHDWLDVGGSLRFRGELRSNYDLDEDASATTDNDEFLLGRLRLWAKLTPSDHVNAFVEIQSAWVWESEIIDPEQPDVGGANIYQDRADIQQAYAEVLPWADEVGLSFRIGRQNLEYGRQRLVGSFQWGNTARSFEAFRARYDYDKESWWVDAFAAQVVVHQDDRRNKTDNSLTNADDDSTLWGVYGGYRGLEWADLEFYWLLRDNDNLEQEVHTIGARLQGKVEAWDYEAELAIQFGDWAEDVDHNAMALHLAAGYTLSETWGRPRFGLQYSMASGDDDPTDGEHGTFDNLYPTNHLHYGYMDFFSWRNMQELGLTAKVHPAERLWVKAHLRFFWVDEPEDQWYNAGGGATAGVGPAAGRNADDFVGEELDIVVGYTPELPWFGKSLSLQAGYAHFFAASFVDDVKGADDGANFFYLQTTFKF